MTLSFISEAALRETTAMEIVRNLVLRLGLDGEGSYRSSRDLVRAQASFEAPLAGRLIQAGSEVTGSSTDLFVRVVPYRNTGAWGYLARASFGRASPGSRSGYGHWMLSKGVEPFQGRPRMVDVRFDRVGGLRQICDSITDAFFHRQPRVLTGGALLSSPFRILRDPVCGTADPVEAMSGHLLRAIRQIGTREPSALNWTDDLLRPGGPFPPRFALPKLLVGAILLLAVANYEF